MRPGADRRAAIAAAAAFVLALTPAGAAFDRQAVPAPGPTAQDISLPTATGPLAGTLLMPAAPARPPVVLIIAGSGPTDRDGNSALLSGANNGLRMLAEALAAQGVASVRYDKRGLAASAPAALPGGERAARLETFIDDAAAWITMLRNDARFPIVAVAGHSEGALVGIVAARMARADGVVTIAGPGRRMGAVLREQLKAQIGGMPELWQASESALASLEAGRTVDEVPPLLQRLFRPSVQPFLISALRYDPAEEFGRLVVPGLILQGTTDLQVAVEDAKALAAAKPDATLEIVRGMNHVLKSAEGPLLAQMPSYGNPDLPIVAAVPTAIASFAARLEPFGRGGVGGPRPRQARRSPRTLAVGTIDGARIAIEYGQPQKRGREIWGALVPWRGIWMPGADEATTLVTRDTLFVGDLELGPGDYTIYTEPRAEGVILILNGEVGQFHTVHHASRDLGRVPMTQAAVDGPPVEGLTYAVVPSPGGGGRLTLTWDDREYSVALRVRGAAGR